MLGRVYRGLYKRIAPISFARSIGVKIGDGCRLINVDFGSEPWLVSLGSRVSASDTQFITHDGGVWVFREEFPELDVLAPIAVGDNVFIGSRTILLPGAVVGNDVVIGAGSVVRGSIEPSTVVAGVPARKICTLQDYRNRVLSRGRPTKLLSSHAKRSHYQSR